MPLLTKTISAVLLVLFLQAPPVSASFTAAAEPELYGAQVLVADLHGLGTQSLLLGKDQGVFVLENGEQRQILEVSGRVTALAVGDLTGDFRPDLAVGTEGVGALYLYTERDGTWERHGHAQYLWDTVVRLGIYDFNNDGWGDVAALTDKGEVYVYLSREGSLFPLWRSPAGEHVVGFEVLDVDGSGNPEFIFALRSGYVAALTWGEEEFVTLWENYPWGAVESLVAIPHPSAPEWLVVTSQKMLYGWRWQNGEVVPSRAFEAKALGEHLVYIPQQGLLSLSGSTGVSLFELQSAAVVEKWRVPGLLADSAFFYQGEFYVHDRTNAYLRLVEGTPQWRLFVYETEVTGFVDILLREGEVYANLLELAPVLGLTVELDDGWQVMGAKGQITLWSDRAVLRWNEMQIPLSRPLLEEGGVPFVPLDVLPLLGWTVQVDSLRQLLVFLETWGWWI